MFFAMYLWRELWRRKRQAMVIASGLALSVGLVITVTALSAGVRIAQGDVLKTLYGVGTDITVMTQFESSASGFNRGGEIAPGPKTQHFDTLQSVVGGPIASSQVAALGKLHGVAVAAGGLILTDTRSTVPGYADLPTSPGSMPPGFLPPILTSVVGVDLANLGLGPYSAGKIAAGRTFAGSDDQSDVAVIDSRYAAKESLQVGSTVTIANVPFTAIGIVTQLQDSNAPNVYIPLPRAQALSKMSGYVNTVYLRASNASDVDAVSDAISKLMPSATVTNSSSLADAITGSLATTANLATTFGTWLTVLVLTAAFAVASLLTMGAVSHRVREFGTLKALGWRSWRITAQVMGESVAVGLVGAAMGIALGLAGISIAPRAMPSLSATVHTANNDGSGFGNGLGANGGLFAGTVGGPTITIANPSASHTVAIPFTAPITIGTIGLAVVLAIAGGFVAGSFGGWRIARLRPAAALARLE